MNNRYSLKYPEIGSNIVKNKTIDIYLRIMLQEDGVTEWDKIKELCLLNMMSQAVGEYSMKNTK
eukprot:Pgem_evm1s6013